MENIVVSTFRNIQDANAGLSKLKDLDQLNDITIYNMVMIRKKAEGKFEFLYQDGPDTQDLPADGAMAGTLIGALAGPIGMAIGMLTGVMVGAADEGDTEDMSQEFLDDVNKRLSIDGIAIVLDVEEDGAFMIDSYLEPFHGVIARRDTAAEFDKYDQEQWQKLKDEIAKEEQQLKQARDEDKAAIKARIAKLRSESDEKIKKIKERHVATIQHLQNKLKALDEKWKASNQQMKDRVEQHREKLKEKLSKINETI
jgi:uncharacterized membrane protein